MKYTIDATEKKLGRVATDIAVLLMGKNSSNFRKNVVADVKVNVINASKLDINNKKMESKKYKRYSGYPGGLKMRTMSQEIEKKGYGEIVKKAVYGMLPSNKLRSIVIKNLTIEE